MDVLKGIIKDPRIIYLPIFLAITLQIFLSRAKNNKLGLILPWVSFFISIAIVIAMGMKEVNFKSEPFMFLFMLILVLNIPTIILMAVYAICRRLRKNNEKLSNQI